MGKRQRKRDRKIGTKQLKARFPIYQTSAMLLFSIGSLLLAWSAYNLSSPFPYAIFIGIGAIASATIITVACDKSKWSKNRQNYSDDPDRIGPHHWW